MAKEFERKFRFKKEEDAYLFIKNNLLKDKITKIEQSYLISKYAKLTFNDKTKQWNISLNLKDNTQINFSAPIDSEDLLEIYEILERSKPDNLLDIDRMSSRVRFKAGKTLFTAKFKPDYEFEPEIELPNSMKDILLSNLPSVSKFRHEITIGDYNLELDIFCDNASIPILELEFETKQEELDFNPGDLGLDLIEVTEDNHYRNKYIAIRQFEK